MSVHGFRLNHETPIPSLNLTVRDFTHERTSARHFHFDTEDGNNAFLVAFLTVPQDSTGIAHILEHTSLCGSERFPVRDPFFMMIRRSLNTFMNAFTASDWTAYPFASQNRKDFDNLLEVYLDAVFFPLLDPLDFAQEGHRVEFSQPDDATSPLEYKGVVYNEMKGAMSAPISQVAQTLQSTLFPTITYHHNSGGDPLAIPDLTHEALTRFHARHYHPSNAVFMTYGSFPPDGHQERMSRLALDRFTAEKISLAVSDEQRFTAPRMVAATYATDDEDVAGKAHVLVGWLWDKTTDPMANMEARLLAGVLLDNSASPLRHALETSELGTAPSELCGMDDTTREATFVCGLEGCDEANADAVEALIIGTLERLAHDGVSQDIVESVVHQVELAQREVSGGGFPYGLQIMVRGLGPALYGGNPVEALDLDPALATLRERAADPQFVPEMIKRLMLENTHRVRLTMTPDPELPEHNREQERSRLDALETGLNADQRQAIVALAAKLKARQEAEDDPDLLPQVTIDDVPDELAIPQPAMRLETPLKTTVYTPGTNGLVYVQLVAELPPMDAETLQLLPLFCDFFSDVGAGRHTYLEMQAWQAAVTGGVRARTSFRSRVETLDDPRAYFVLAGKALARNQSGLVDLLRETFENARFDELDRLAELVSQARLHAESQVTDSGHSLALLAASAGLSACASLEHRWGGLAGLHTLKALDTSLTDRDALELLGQQLTALREGLASSACEVLLIAEPNEAEDLRHTVRDAWQGPHEAPHPSGDFSAHTAGFAPSRVQAAWVTNTQVNFCAHAYAAPPQGSEDAAVLRVLGAYLRNGYLHRAIREQGGAYGAGAGYSPDSGAFRFFSYRDPRLEGTLNDFRGSIEWLLQPSHPDRLLEEAILGVVGEIDRPDSPAGEAVIGYFGALHGRTTEQRRTLRRQVLDVSKDDLNRVCETYLANEAPSTSVVTSVAALDAELGLAKTLDRHTV